MTPSEDYGGTFEQGHWGNIGSVVVALKIRSGLKRGQNRRQYNGTDVGERLVSTRRMTDLVGAQLRLGTSSSVPRSDQNLSIKKTTTDAYKTRSSPGRCALL